MHRSLPPRVEHRRYPALIKPQQPAHHALPLFAAFPGHQDCGRLSHGPLQSLRRCAALCSAGAAHSAVEHAALRMQHHVDAAAEHIQIADDGRGIRRLMRLRSTALPSTLPAVIPTRGPVPALPPAAPQRSSVIQCRELLPAGLVHALVVGVFVQPPSRARRNRPPLVASCRT